MKRIAHIENNEIVSVSLAEDDANIEINCMLEAEAIALGIPYKQRHQTVSGFFVNPEGFYLGIEKEDETEFNKLITLITLGLQYNKIAKTSPIDIWDVDKTAHNITVERFLEIMIDYGMYCYAMRK